MNGVLLFSSVSSSNTRVSHSHSFGHSWPFDRLSSCCPRAALNSAHGSPLSDCHHIRACDCTRCKTTIFTCIRRLQVSAGRRVCSQLKNVGEKSFSRHNLHMQTTHIAVTQNAASSVMYEIKRLKLSSKSLNTPGRLFAVRSKRFALMSVCGRCW
jgi:hypothetical protein